MWSIGNALGPVHFGCALASLAAGLVVCLSRKGTAWHRGWGWAYVASMVALNATALLIYRLLGHFGPFHAAAISTTLRGVPRAIAGLRRRPGRTDLSPSAT
jgi:uncharacterized membrane protein